jgi:hypothetical protein
MTEVLGLIGFVTCVTSGDQVRGPCPIHRSASPSGDTRDREGRQSDGGSPGRLVIGRSGHRMAPRAPRAVDGHHPVCQARGVEATGWVISANSPARWVPALASSSKRGIMDPEFDRLSQGTRVS